MAKKALGKVLLIINSLQGGGAERSVLTLGSGFNDLGYEVHILRFNSIVDYELSDNLNYHEIDFKPFRKIPIHILRYRIFAKVVDKYVKDHIGQPIITLSNLDRSDRVMRYSMLPNIFFIIRNELSKKIQIMSRERKDWSTKHMLDIYSSHPCVCISYGVENDLRQTLGISNTTTIYNPIDKYLINKLASEPIGDTELFKDYIVHVGSFKDQKAHNVLIKAYAKSKMDLPLVLIGKGKLMKNIQSLVESLGITDKVIFLGFKNNPYPYIKNAKLMVLSSNFEGFGRVIAESLAVGTPVISTDCPSGPRELLPAENLVPVADIDALANKLTEVMLNPVSFKSEFNDSLIPINIAKQYIELLGK